MAALTILLQPAVAEHIDRALLDRQVGGAFAASRSRAPPSAPARCRHGRPRRCRREAESYQSRIRALHRRIGLAARRARRRHLSAWRAAKKIGIGGLHLAPASSLPTGRSRSRAADRRSHNHAAAVSARRAPAPWSCARAAERARRRTACDDLSRPSRASRSARMCAGTATAWLRPRSLSGMSCVPCSRPVAHSTSVSPWRM